MSKITYGDKHIACTQWTTTTCSGGTRPQGNRKEAWTNKCTQDYPLDMYSHQIKDFSGCSSMLK
ncbi:MAG: hypothetical protein H7844_11480 [Nitrospirae bacterium YQR-1]